MDAVALQIAPNPPRSPAAAFHRLNDHPLMQSSSAAWQATLSTYQQHLLAAGVPDEKVRLGPWEENVENPTSDTFERTFRFRNFASERSLWLAALPLVETDHARLQRFRNCGTRTWIKIDEETGRYVFTSETCKLRICPACRRRIQRAGSDRIAAMLTGLQKDQWQLITLTLRHSKRPLPDQLTFLRRSFRRLRQRKLWTDAVQHGYAVLEIARNVERDEWHPHLHVVARTNFIDYKRLRNAWRAITIGSDQVNCKKIKSATRAADYVAKYLGKPPDNSLFSNPDRLAEYYRALQSSRLMIPFGDPPKPKTDPETKPKPKLRLLGSLDDIRAAHAAGDTELGQHWPLIEEQTRHEAEWFANIRDGIPTGPRSPPPQHVIDSTHDQTNRQTATPTAQSNRKQLRIW